MDDWFLPMTEMEHVDFGADDEGNWLGTWSTPDDRMQEELLNEETEYEGLVFENIGIVNQQRRLVQADDLSARTFGLGEDESTAYVSEGSAGTIASAAVDSQSTGVDGMSS